MKKVFVLAFGVIITALFVLQVHNIVHFPLNRGFDALNHIDYVNYLKTIHQIPMANEGWELYQAPLYYLLAMIFSKTEFIRLLNLFMWLILLIASFLFFNKIFKKIEFSLLSTILVISLPAVIYLTPTISNELFSGIMISITLMYYAINRNRFNLYDQIITGSLLGLSLLSKVTAFILLFCICLDLFIKYLKNFRMLLIKITIPLIIILAIAGWFYIRNIILFSNPFISSIDFPQFAMHQTPGFRDIKFFTDLSGFFKMDLFQAHHYSLWAGTYFSWFFDAHNVIVPVQSFSKIGILLIFLSIPIFIFFILGYIKELKSKSKNIVLLLYPVMLFLAYIAYNFKLPFYSTVKGTFLVSAIVPFVYFTVQPALPGPLRLEASRQVD
ncbi:MAG: hypothetical protein Q7R95_11740 [bacterium]|nr:hypothetical protein [bacterium]